MPIATLFDDKKEDDDEQDDRNELYTGGNRRGGGGSGLAVIGGDDDPDADAVTRMFRHSEVVHRLMVLHLFGVEPFLAKIESLLSLRNYVFSLLS